MQQNCRLICLRPLCKSCSLFAFYLILLTIVCIDSCHSYKTLVVDGESESDDFSDLDFEAIEAAAVAGSDEG